MSERPGESQPVARGHHDLVWDDLPEHERSIVEADLPSLQRWIREHPEVAAAVELDRSAFDAGQGHVLLVATVHGDPGAVRSDLESVVAHPDRLRVRADRPTAGELRRLLRWVIDTRMADPGGGSRTVITGAGVDDGAGVVVVTLNRRDQRYTDELVAASGGLVRVEAEPSNPQLLVPPRYAPRDPSR